MSGMAYARAIIAAVLATGLIVVVVMREITTGEFIEGADATATAPDDPLFGQLDATFLMLSIAIVILIVPDAISYVRRKKKPQGDDEDE